ncbi:DUF3995 domain-containing protein [uncultured Pseudoteredinibacter sp.]|uniref:DUF3995 domain-containing protein n=1 Tax=uncultured Pseudoteredinibacter sp. TaxID=1641701 RepID=UPI002632EF93|nr:DUF3995 domain-containing protein [uncultured Pseudoteredinibacter sp.]
MSVLSVVVAILVAVIMLLVSLFHFYWAFGGEYGLQSSGPVMEEGVEFKPPAAVIFVVACLLAGLAVLSLQLVWPWQPIKEYIAYVGYLISFVFIVRSIGDFKYVGFFKKVYNSDFANLDTKYFSPLILLLGVCFGVLSVFGV